MTNFCLRLFPVSAVTPLPYWFLLSAQDTFFDSNAATIREVDQGSVEPAMFVHRL
jgi:hypothetical protein